MSFDNTAPDPHALDARWTAHKPPVRVVATTPEVVAEVGVDSEIDGVTLVLGDRVLLAGQTAAAENGIYDVGASSLSRSADANADEEFTAGMVVDVQEGTAGRGKRYRLTTDPPIEVGTDAIAFAEFAAAPEDPTLDSARSGTFDNTAPGSITV
jgi:phage-related tail fiber protein